MLDVIPRRRNSRPLLVPGHVEVLDDVVHILAGIDASLNLLPQLDEVAFLRFEQVFAGDSPVSWTDHLDIELMAILQHADPRSGVTMAYLVERAVHADIAR